MLETMLLCENCGQKNVETAHFCQSCGVPLQADGNMDHYINRRMGSYLLHSKLGEGGFGVVYLAIRENTSEKFAVKILHPQFSANDQIVERFRREAFASAKVKHKNIVEIVDFGQIPGIGFYYVMEYLEGKTLKAFLDEKGFLSKEETLHISRQVCSAMQKVHDNNVLHRDLKPDNIFLMQKDGDPLFVKLVDFGIAKLLGEEDHVSITKTGLSVGTPLYMSPEQAKGNLKNLDFRTDIYSWSVILFEMLTGNPPFYSEAPHEVLLMHIKGRPPRLSDSSPHRQFGPELESQFRHFLSKNPAERPASMTELSSYLEKALSEAEAITDHVMGVFPSVSSRSGARDSSEMVSPSRQLSLHSASGTTSEHEKELRQIASNSFLSEPVYSGFLNPETEESGDSHFSGSPELRRLSRFASRTQKQDEERLQKQSSLMQSQEEMDATLLDSELLESEHLGSAPDLEPLVFGKEEEITERLPSPNTETASNLWFLRIILVSLFLLFLGMSWLFYRWNLNKKSLLLERKQEKARSLVLKKLKSLQVQSIDEKVRAKKILAKKGLSHKAQLPQKFVVEKKGTSSLSPIHSVKSNKITLSKKPSGSKASFVVLSINSTPKASVYFGKKYVGMTPYKMKRIKGKTWSITLVRKGYQRKKVSFSSFKNEKKEIFLQSKRVKKKKIVIKKQRKLDIQKNDTKKELPTKKKKGSLFDSADNPFANKK